MKPTATITSLPAIAPIVGTVLDWSEAGAPLVAFAGAPSEPVRARTTIPRPPGALEGREVLLLFVENASERPVVVGLLQPDSPEVDQGIQLSGTAAAVVDGRRVEITGAEEVVLRCGKASISLRRDGRVAIRGVRVESRSEGTNRIKGGNVAIN